MKKILIQLDHRLTSQHFRSGRSAVDAGVEELFSYGGITPETVEPLRPRRAIFTRGPKDLKSTAIFVGGSQVSAGERVAPPRVRDIFRTDAGSRS